MSSGGTAAGGNRLTNPAPFSPLHTPTHRRRRAGNAGTGRGLLICDFVLSLTVTPKTFDSGTDGPSGTFLAAEVRGFSSATVALVDSPIFCCTIGEKTLSLQLCVLTDKWVKKKNKLS